MGTSVRLAVYSHQKSVYVRGRDSKRMYKAFRTLILFCDELSQILKRDYTVAPGHTVQCSGEKEADSNEAVFSMQQLHIALQDCSEDFFPPVTLFLRPFDEPRTQKTQKVGQRQLR